MWFVSAHLDELDPRQMAELPYGMRYVLMETLPVVDIWKLEKQGVTQGLDMDRVWSEVCTSHGDFYSSGLDFVHLHGDPHPPKRGPIFHRSIDCKEMLFQRLWADLEKSRNNLGYLHHVLKLLFWAPAGPLRNNYFERASNALNSLSSLDGPSRPRTTQCVEQLKPKEIIKNVLSLMMNSGWRPSHLVYSPLVECMKENKGDIEQLLSRVQFVSATAGQTKDECFETLLSNPIATLGLSVQYDRFAAVKPCVQECMKRKKLEELIVHLNDVRLADGQLAGLTDELFLSRHLRLLEITSLHHLDAGDDETATVAFRSSLIAFLQRPAFLCLRLYNVTTVSTAKSLIVTFLSTPCLNEQTLELGGLTPDAEQERCFKLPDTKESPHPFNKSLVVDNVAMINEETLEMNTDLRIEDVFLCDSRGSLASWLFSLHNMKVAKLLLKDYSVNIDHIAVPETVRVGKLTIFTVLPLNHNHRSLWTNTFFTSALSNPLLRECAWHVRLSPSPSHPFQCREVVDDLCPVLLEHVPRGCTKKLSITINENIEHLCKSNLGHLMEATSTLRELQLDVAMGGSSYWTYSDGSTYTHIRF